MQLSQLLLVHATATEMALQLELTLPFALRLHCSVHVMQSVSGLNCLIACSVLLPGNVSPDFLPNMVYLTCARCKISLFVMLFC